MSTRDFWGDVPDVTPHSLHAILREQGERLAEKTNNEVRGYVPIRPFSRRVPAPEGAGAAFHWEQGFTVDFYFEVPNLNGYRYLFLEVELPVSMGFPVKLIDHINDEEHTCHSREEFEQKLEAAFKSPAVRDVIAGLRTASRGMNQAWSRPLTQE